MPEAALPTSVVGWAAAIAASTVGLIVSFLFLRLLNGWLG